MVKIRFVYLLWSGSCVSVSGSLASHRPPASGCNSTMAASGTATVIANVSILVVICFMVGLLATIAAAMVTPSSIFLVMEAAQFGSNF